MSALINGTLKSRAERAEDIHAVLYTSIQEAFNRIEADNDIENGTLDEYDKLRVLYQQFIGETTKFVLRGR